MSVDEILDREEVLRELLGSINAKDDRINRHKRFSLAEVLLLVLCAQLSNFTTFREYEHYGKIKLNLLRKIFPYENGAPSRSTIARVLLIIDPKELESLLTNIANRLCSDSSSENNNEYTSLAIDGKTCRGARGGKVHLVNAFDTGKGICFGQEKVDDKSNEITAIPKLIKSLNIENMLVSIDAMGNQIEIAKLIREKKGHYFLAVKANQKNLLEELEDFFGDEDLLKTCDFTEEVDAGHGRVEKRQCYTTSDIDWLSAKCNWHDLKSIVMVISHRWIKDTYTVEKRYYTTSASADAEVFLRASRAHWGIENKLNWVLDVILQEDDRILWNKVIVQNEATIRRIGLNLLRKYQAIHPYNKKYEKVALKTIRKSILIDDEEMLKLLRGGI